MMNLLKVLQSCVIWAKILSRFSHSWGSRAELPYKFGFGSQATMHLLLPQRIEEGRIESSRKPLKAYEFRSGHSGPLLSFLWGLIATDLCLEND